MKRRSGFVSNSSTSSFIVTAPSREHLRLVITKVIDLGEGAMVASTIEQLDAMMICHFGDRSYFEGLGAYRNAAASIEAGRVAIMASNRQGSPVDDVLTDFGLGYDVDEEYAQAVTAAGVEIELLEGP